MSSIPRVLITGVTGFIGPRLAQSLVRQGFEVHGIAREKSVQASNSHTESNENKLAGVQLHFLRNTAEELKPMIAEIKPDCCFHLATFFKAQHVYQDIPAMIESNLTFGTLLADSLVAAKVPFLINAGTAWQHFESRSYSPVCLYASMKQAFEDILKYYAEVHPIRVLNLKLFDTYGPKDPRRKLVNVLKECTVTGKEFQASDGKQWIDLIYIDDVVAGFERAWQVLKETTEPFQSYSLSSGKPVQISQLVKTIQKVGKREIPVKWNVFPSRPREMMEPWVAGTLLPGWEPKVSLEEGLQSLY